MPCLAVREIEKAAEERKRLNGLASDSQSKPEGGVVEDESPPPGKAHYLVSKENMKNWGYPGEDDDNCVHTKHVSAVTGDSPLFGIDCEMVNSHSDSCVLSYLL